MKMEVSAFNRGRMDAYYGRPPRPHKWSDPLGRKEITDLSPQEIADYWRGYDEEDERKDWGE